METETLKCAVETELLQANEEMQDCGIKIEKLNSAIEKCKSDYGKQIEEIQELRMLQDKLAKEKEEVLTANKQLITANRELLSINANMQEQVFKYENTVESMAQDMLKIGQTCQEKEKANKKLIEKIEELQSKLDFVMNELSKLQEKKKSRFISFFTRSRRNRS